MKADEGTEFMQCIPNTTDYDITSWWWWDKLRGGLGSNSVAGKDALHWFGGPALVQQKKCKLQTNEKDCLSLQIDLGWDKPNYGPLVACNIITGGGEEGLDFVRFYPSDANFENNKALPSIPISWDIEKSTIIYGDSKTLQMYDTFSTKLGNELINDFKEWLKEETDKSHLPNDARDIAMFKFNQANAKNVIKTLCGELSNQCVGVGDSKAPLTHVLKPNVILEQNNHSLSRLKCLLGKARPKDLTTCSVFSKDETNECILTQNDVAVGQQYKIPEQYKENKNLFFNEDAVTKFITETTPDDADKLRQLVDALSGSGGEVSSPTSVYVSCLDGILP